jgi:hypothetical protein
MNTVRNEKLKKLSLTEKIMMCPETGSMDTLANWQAEQKADGWDIKDLDSLIEVYWDNQENCWVEIE